MFKKILIANRGEIALRVIAACRELEIKSVAIYSEPDKESRHVAMADEAWRLEGQPAKVYLDAAQIIDLAKKANADAIHPGYGFLSENADFAQACGDAGIKFIGPKPDVIRKMGSKVESRRAMEAAGVPVVPGTCDPVSDPQVVKELGTKYGYPICIKASAGGGGRGLRVVRNEAEVDSALSGAQREGASYFGSGEVYVEKYLELPRHIEVQVLGDEHGNLIHLTERDCSSQRRHQKLLEETPAPELNKDLREQLLDSAVKGAKSLGYSSAGTLEYLVADDHFYFLEVNTRVQVEHPITEMVTGVDIVKEQIMVATGAKLSLKQEDVAVRGHSIEFRINAEDPMKNFMPSPGTIKNYSEPRMPWMRLDSACYEGYQVLPFYDSLLAKLIVWGRTREEAIARGRVALKNYKIEGLSTTIPFHLAILDDKKFQSGQMNTKYVEAELIKTFMAQGAALSLGKSEKSPGDNNGHSPDAPQRIGPRSFEVEVNQRMFKVAVTEVVSGHAVATMTLPKPQAQAATRAGKPSSRPVSSKAAAPGANEVKAAMHGLVKELLVKEGDTVEKGQKLLIFEAMKMESEVVAGRAGRIATLHVKAGETVEASSVMLVVAD